MMNVLDINDYPLTYVAITLHEIETLILVVRVPCLAGMFLTADVPEESANVLVEARATGSGDPFVAISTSPLSLTFFDDPTDFDIRVQTGDVDGLKRVAIRVRVTFNP